LVNALLATPASAYSLQHDGATAIRVALEACVGATVAADSAAVILAYQTELFKLITETSIMNAGLFDVCATIQTLLGRAADPAVIDAIDYALRPAHTVSRALDAFALLGDSVESRAVADLAPDHLRGLVASRHALLNSTKTHPAKDPTIAEIVNTVLTASAALLAAVADILVTQQGTSLAELTNEQTLDMKDLTAWSADLPDDADFAAVLAVAGDTILKQQPSVFRAKADAIQKQILAFEATVQLFDSSEQQSLTDARRLQAAYTRLYIDSLLVAIFQPPCEDDDAKDRKKKVLKVMKFAKDANIDWNSLRGFLRVRAQQAKQLE
jgi:hypothetical protein